MSTILDEPDDRPATKNTPSQRIYLLIALQLFFHLYCTIFQGQINNVLILVLVLCPLLIVYFLLPMYVLLLVQLFFYLVVTYSNLEENRGLGKKLHLWRHQWDYWVVLIACQSSISLFFMWGLNPF